MFKKLFLKRREERRIRAGHLWIYSNEVDTQKSPLKSFVPGEQVEVYDARDTLLGSAYINPQSLICARIYCKNRIQELNVDYLSAKLADALSLRAHFYDTPHYRWVYGEADSLPGLVIDRFDNVIAIQTNTRGMELQKDFIVEAVKHHVPDADISFKNLSSLRALEGMDSYQAAADGKEIPAEISLQENGVNFVAPFDGGQKTGWFFDHQFARKSVANWAKNKTVLDLFSYVGGWGIQLATAGASHVTCVDTSELAIDFVAKNAELNNVSDRVIGEVSDVFDYLQHVIKQGKQFDIVIADPPAFIKRKKDEKKGVEAYQRLFRLAMQALAPNGMLVAASCSQHFSQTSLHDAVRRAALKVNVDAKIIAAFSQAPDHPVHPSIPETQYLKTVVAATGA